MAQAPGRNPAECVKGGEETTPIAGVPLAARQNGVSEPEKGGWKSRTSLETNFFICNAADGPFTRGAITGWALIFIRIRTLLHSPHPRCFLVTTSHFDHDRQITTTEGSRQGSAHIELHHRCPQSRQGGRERRSSKGRVWHSRHPSRHDSSEPPSLLQ